MESMCLAKMHVGKADFHQVDLRAWTNCPSSAT